MVIYEVSISVEKDAAEEYEAWLADHIREIITLEGFAGAEWYECTDVASDRREYVVRYELRDRASLDNYFSNHAERMRRDGTDRFGNRFTASRRVMERRARFTVDDP